MNKNTRINGENQKDNRVQTPKVNSDSQNIDFKEIDSHFKIRNIKEVLADGAKVEERKKLFGCFLYKGVNTFFFSRSNYGKSLLGFNIGFAAAIGESIYNNSALTNECLPMRVLVLDVELDERDLFDRHEIISEFLPQEYADNFIFVHEELHDAPLFGIELLKRIENIALKSKAELIIIDNLTKLLTEYTDAKVTAEVIATLQRIRIKTGASFLVIGHTSKADKRLAIKNDSYFGSAFIENFFFEIFYLDETMDNKFFLRHSKSKRAEKYEDVVPVFSRGDHPKLGIGFSFEEFRNYDDVKKPDILNQQSKRKRPIADFTKEIQMLLNNNVKQSTIALMCDVSKPAISRLINKA